MITKHEAVATTAAGETIDAYILSAGGTRARILTYGGIITHLFTLDRNGEAGDIVLGFDDDARYLTKHPYLGALVGRFAGRIANGRFTLDGAAYTLPTNNGPNHLHGGVVGYDKRVWKAETIDDVNSPALRLTLRDPDGAEGYPGNVDVTVTYTVKNGLLRLEYEAQSDRATPLNLTNHTYFNLHDAGASKITDHTFQADCDLYLAGDAALIPIGEPKPVKGTPIDFTTAKPMGQDLAAMGGSPVGYDNSLVLREPPDGATLRRAGMAADPKNSGRSIECWTTELALQFYTGNFLDGSVTGKGGATYAQYHGFCLETQRFPDSPNHPSYPSTILRPGTPYRSTTEYRFATV